MEKVKENLRGRNFNYQLYFRPGAALQNVPKQSRSPTTGAT